ncbi:MAG: hypothetical protein HeimC2_17790 [Candidatus Heimdallarchaeota archaeon LC_2]|nr:MAG: hypothetical protein HeimC2_17790 [Candidatus Heimdallarchaeota archaeon LC_2]
MSENMQTCSSCGELVPIEYVVCVWCGFDLTAEHIRRSGIVVGRNEAFGRMKRVTLDPFNTFKEISLIPDLKGPRYIFYFIGVAMTLNMLAVFSKLDGLAFNDENLEIILYARYNIGIKVTTVIALTFLLIQPIFLFIIFNFVWRTGTRFIGFLSKTFGGTGDKEKIRSVIGYSMLPVLYGWTLAWILRLLSPSETVSDPDSYASIEEALITVSKDGIGAVANFIIILSWIWAAGLAIIGISRVTRLSYVEGVIVAGFPYLLFMTVVT